MPTPRGREKNITGQGKSMERRGEGLGTGPVGNADYSSRPGMNTAPKPQTPAQKSSGVRAGGNPSVNRAAPGQGGQDRGIGLDTLINLANSSNNSQNSSNSYINLGGNGGNGGNNNGGSYQSFSGNNGGNAPKRGKSKLLTIIIIVILAILLFKMCGSMGSSSSGYTSSGSSTVSSGNSSLTVTAPATTSTSSDEEKPGSYGSSLNDLLGSSGYSYSPSSGYGFTNGSVSSGWSMASNTGKLDSTVVSGARAKYTKLKGNGKDTVTIMVYMCGTDLESQSGMASSDLKEMASATLSDKVNIIVYTGGCRQWKTSGISSSVNQIYRIRQGSIERLESDMGKSAMTAPDNLSEFIQYCKKNYKADRNILVLWDHGGGSLSGYGYDEKYSSSGSMTLTGIRQALKDGGVKFDIIGFDACLMATVETGLACADYGDYMIASEESEPGVGWYYTNWLTSLCANTSIPTVELGKLIVDDFVSVCARQCSGQKTTLSVTDLAELSKTVPNALTDFAVSLCEKMENDEYKTISSARSSAREFASSSRIDQMDVADFANLIGSDEAKDLMNAILGAVKYNGTSSNMTNAYGLSIYFPYRTLSYVNKAVKIYDAVDMNEEYTRCIQKYAGMETSGQAVSGGSSSPLYSLFGDSSSYYSGYGSSSGSYSSGSSSSSGSTSYYDLSDLFGSYSSSGYGSSYGSSGSYGSNGGYGYGYGAGSGYGSSYYGSTYSGSSSYGGSSYSSSGYSDVYDILSGLLGGSFRGVKGINEDNSEFLGRSIDLEKDAEYIAENSFDPMQLIWDENGTIALPAEQWSLITGLDLNVFYDDGEGFIDLGLDNSYSFDDNGALIGEYDGTWTAINGQAVAYYHESTVDDGENYTITGYVPVLLNGTRANLILVFDNEHPYGYVAGARTVYTQGETETVAKSWMNGVESDVTVNGDIISFNDTAAETELLTLQDGDVIDFVCDYYSYEGEYVDSFMFGEQMVVDGEPEISYVYLPDPSAASALYRFTDIYQQTYWTTMIP